MYCVGKVGYQFVYIISLTALYSYQAIDVNIQGLNSTRRIGGPITCANQSEA